jgi:hypothetical protein
VSERGNRGAVEHDGLARAADSVAPLARVEVSDEVKKSRRGAGGAIARLDRSILARAQRVIKRVNAGASHTLHVVQAFEDRDGSLVAIEPQACPSAGSARALAAKYARTHAGIRV